MIKIEKIIIFALIVLTIVDALFLLKYLIIHEQNLSPTTNCRLITFILCHLYFAFMLIIQYKLQNQLQIDENFQIYRQGQWLVNTFVPISAIDTFIQIALFIALGTQKNLHLNNSNNISVSAQQQHEAKSQQLHLINFYFLVYMYSTILGILATLYLWANRMLENYEKSKYEDMVNDILDTYLYEYDIRDSILKQKQCSICQFGFDGHQQQKNNFGVNNINGQNAINRVKKVQVVCLQCDHMFHKQCILQWVKKTYESGFSARCPNCRQNIN